MILLHLTPNGLRLRLYSANSTIKRHRTIQYAHRALHLHSEVHVARSVDDVDLVLFGFVGGFSLCSGVIPKTSGCSGGNGDPALLFLFHPVHCGSSVAHLTNFVVDASVIEDALGGRGLSRVNVGTDANVAGVF